MFSSAEIMSWRYKWEELTCFPSNLEGGKKSVLALLGLEMQRCETVWLLGFRQINEQLGAGGGKPSPEAWWWPKQVTEGALLRQCPFESNRESPSAHHLVL